MADLLAPGTTKYEMRSDTELVYSRVFNAPRDIVFAMFTESEHLTQWVGIPQDTMEIVEQDLRPGGKFRWEFHRDGDLQVVVFGEYGEIVPDEFIEHHEQMEFGGMTTPSARCTLTLTEEAGHTLTVHTMEFPDPQTAQMALDSGMKDGIDIGFSSLDSRLRDQP